MRQMTTVQKIFAAHAARDYVHPGEIIFAKVDRMLLNDVSGPYAIQQFKQMASRVCDPERIVLVNDHFAPPKDVPSAEGLLSLQKFAREHSLPHMYEQGSGGIEHTLLPEKGLVMPGDLIVGGDSHTCTYGAFGAVGIGMGSTDLAATMAVGQLWFTVPETIRFHFEGKRRAWVTGKDLILHVLADIGVDGATYRSMEFTGSAIRELPIDDRMALCNMSVEAGGKNCIIVPDEITREWVEKIAPGFQIPLLESDPGAPVLSERRYNVSEIGPLIAKPFSPGNVGPVADVEGTKVDQVYIGNCANGTISDLRQAASVLRGNSINKNTRCVIVPATQKIYKQAIKEGLIDIFIDAGAVISPPTCGACAGLHMGVLAPGQTAIANTNRNFRGRMGHPDSQVFLANSYVCAAAAIAGEIVSPQRTVQ